jgi:hypothetical protein
MGKKIYLLLLFFKRIVCWVGASPDAARSAIQIAGKAMTAAMCQDAWWLVGHDVGWIHHLCLQANFLVDMLAELDFKGFPGFFGHFMLR